MKRSLLALVGLLLISSFINAQVVKDFEVDVSGFSDGDWGVFITGVEQVADPSSESSGVLAVHLDATQTGGDPKDPAVSYGGFEFENVPTAMVYYLWLPADIPDLVDIKPFAQDDTWDWHDVKYTAGDMPKETWFPVYVNLEAWTRSGSVYGNKINGYGIEFAGWNLAGDDTTWSGTVYIDNLTILGVEPEIYNDFEDQTAGVGSLVGGGWGGAISGINWAADPSSNSTGVVEIPFDGNAGGNDPIYFDNVTEASMYPAIVYDLWVPADAPDSLLLKIFSQDDPNWTWQNDAIYLVDLPKESWVPIIYSFEQKTALGGNFSVKASRIGIEFDRRLMTSADTTWSGTFYLDNIRFIGTETGDKWNVIDFEAAAAGVDGFTSAGWAPATTSMQRIADPSSQSEGVLEVALDFTSSDAIASPKSYVSRNGIILYSEMLQKAANKLTLDVWLPDGFPENYQLGVVVGGGADISNTGWLEIIQPFMGTDSTDGFKTNQWNTMEINIDTLAANSQVDPTQTANIGIQLFIEGEASFVGSIYYDNLTVHGIPEPEGTLSSPELIASIVDSVVVDNGNTVETVRFDWVDNTLGTETYNIYMSYDPITDLDADGVYLIHPGIPHGLEKYAHRPYSNDGGEYDIYYAITSANAGDETGLTGNNTVKITGVKTTPTFKIKYVSDFSSTFSLDGLDNEFEDYKTYQIEPETAGGVEADAWSTASSDLYFKTTMVIDDDYLYISADVTDDDPRGVDEVFQAWQGDALEFYMGFYDLKTTKKWHPINSGQAAGDWRIGFMSTGEVALSGGSATTVSGIEATVFQKFSADGYIIEAKIALDSLSPEGTDFVVSNGLLMPLRIDNNDQDPNLNADEERTLILQVGGTASASDINMDQDWLRPHAWGVAEIIDAPTDVAENDNGLPKEFKLYDNYPNPFNPTTTIKFDVPKQAQVSIRVFDILGSEVATLVNKEFSAGKFETQFNASTLASGTYIVRIIAGDFVQTKKMMLLK